MSEQKPSDPEIRRMLAQLHEALESAPSIDESEQAMMRQLMSDIQASLAQAGHQHSSSFLDRLEGSVESLEVSHPTLSSMIRKALDTLNMAGI